MKSESAPAPRQKTVSEGPIGGGIHAKERVRTFDQRVVADLVDSAAAQCVRPVLGQKKTTTKEGTSDEAAVIRTPGIPCGEVEPNE